MKDFVLMIQFLTRFPLKIDVETGEESFARGVVYFPIIGLMTGSLSYLVYIGTRALLPNGGTLLAAVFATLAMVLFTGGLHIDGLGDTCDGLFSGRKRERILEIMKDSHTGTFGAVGVIMDLLLRITLIAGLTGPFLVLGILLSPMVSKTSVVLLMSRSRYARETGMGGLFLGKMKKGRILIAFLLGTVILNAFLYWISPGWNLQMVFTLNLAVLLSEATILFLFKKWVYNSIQGMTGDTMGAANEIAEWVFLALMVFFSSRWV